MEFLSASLLVAELTLLEEFELFCANVTEFCTGRLQPAVVGSSLLPGVQRDNGAGTGRQIKVVLLARECGNGFSSNLLEALLGLRGPPKEESGVSSAESVYGCQVNSMPTPASEVSSREILPPSLPEPRATRRLTGEQASSGLSKKLQRVSHLYLKRGYHSLTMPHPGPYLAQELQYQRGQESGDGSGRPPQVSLRTAPSGGRQTALLRLARAPKELRELASHRIHIEKYTNRGKEEKNVQL